MRSLGFIACVVVALVSVACSSSTRSVEMHDQESAVWSRVEEFYYDNNDSLARRDIAIVVRYDKGYVADSVPMRILTISPDSLVVEEHFTLQIPHLADMRPEEHTFIYRSNAVLRHKGRYTFRLTPEIPTEGISSVGIVISEPPTIE